MVANTSGACTPTNGCASGYVCPGTGPSANLCEKYKNLGDSCTPGTAECGFPFVVYCSSATSKCTEFPKTGGTCGVGADYVGCLGSWCQVPSSDGGIKTGTCAALVSAEIPDAPNDAPNVGSPPPTIVVPDAARRSRGGAFRRLLRRCTTIGSGARTFRRLYALARSGGDAHDCDRHRRMKNVSALGEARVYIFFTARSSFYRKANGRLRRRNMTHINSTPAVPSTKTTTTTMTVVSAPA